MRDAHRPALRTQNHQVRYRDGALALGDAAFDLLGRIRPRVPLDHGDVLDQRLVAARVHAQHAPALALVPARNHADLVILLQLNPHLLFGFVLHERHQITSGASETIFMKRLSRSSRATGPNTRVPTGSPTSLMSTAALESKRMYVPSLRLDSLRIRTITQRTTLPFLMGDSGVASLTLAVMTSPKPARSPKSPPRGKMHISLRAPLLSATSRMVRIPIMISSQSPSCAMILPSAISTRQWIVWFPDPQPL